MAGTQDLASFDKVTTSENQTWVFNYVTSGENFTNISSLEYVLNVWEEENMNYTEIVDSVSGFINSTII